ncbi:transposase [Ktedonospora formicarum]|uniref:transposase n=1 Tax=Ktedonospora formicarum TaxID=2778364 RepID=UPI001C690A96|nr:transposase [Ktedonospora formicarum]
MTRGQVHQRHALQHHPVVFPTSANEWRPWIKPHRSDCPHRSKIGHRVVINIGEKPLPEDEDAHTWEWAKALARLQTVPGIGLITATWIVDTTMNFTLCADASKAVACAGLQSSP